MNNRERKKDIKDMNTEETPAQSRSNTYKGVRLNERKNSQYSLIFWHKQCRFSGNHNICISFSKHYYSLGSVPNKFVLIWTIWFPIWSISETSASFIMVHCDTYLFLLLFGYYTQKYCNFDPLVSPTEEWLKWWVRGGKKSCRGDKKGGWEKRSEYIKW